MTSARPRVAVITGGASGIGRSIARELAGRGVEVVVADRQVEAAEVLVRDIRRQGGRAEAAELDVRSYDAVKRLVQSTTARTERLDYMFNNAGIGVAGLIESYGIDDWNDVFDVNLRGVTNGVQAAYPWMIAQGFGHIVNTASVAGLIGIGFGSYAASKCAVVSLSKMLRVEAATHGVRVSALCPGVVRTPMLDGGKYGRTTPGGPSKATLARLVEPMRPMDPDDFARRALAAVDRNEAVIVLPRWWKLAWYLDRLSPTLSSWFAAHSARRLRLELDSH